MEAPSQFEAPAFTSSTMRDEQLPLTILIVEDEWAVREVVAMYFEDMGWRVVAVPSGEQAVDTLARDAAIDVVFTDIRLGGRVSGWDVAVAARRADRMMPVIYASGRSSSSSTRRVAGSVFFDKPYQPADIKHACRRMLDTGRLSAAAARRA
ncbi:response regulator [Vineibacter terrae]|uniref:Response regulator n=1 Tax=Vineibacter terrae TaxID=2586908 RepID=A0A5C8PB71_9HYPH|nr:response regulator [Vineibacter terrae]TXL70613.1 response regulator [Vineibacter terrae]